MIEAATNTSLSATGYLIGTSKSASFSYQTGGRQEAQAGQLSVDTVHLSYQLEYHATYSESKTIDTMVNDGYELLRTMVQKVFDEQGLSTKISTGDEEIDFTSLTQQDARELVAEDGYFGVEKTAERIFRFAIGIAGNDPSRIDAIREGVDQGFQEAYDAFGGWLPDISYNTYDAVMQKLTDWIEGFDR